MRRAWFCFFFTLACVSPDAAREKTEPTGHPPQKVAAPTPDSAADPAADQRAALAAAVKRSPIKADEEVMLFPVAAVEDTGAGVWRVPVHGWIYEPEVEDSMRNNLMGGLRRILGDDPGFSTALFTARLRPFLWDNERGKAIPVEAAGAIGTSTHSAANGHFTGAIEIPLADALRHAEQLHGKEPPARLRLRAITREGDDRRFESTAYLVPAHGLSIVSDIDDTVKISQVRDTKLLLRNTFLEPFRPVPGMAETYGKWMAATSGAHLHFVSSSPWQLYSELVRMLDHAGFPDASFDLKTIRLDTTSVTDLFSDPADTKTPPIERLLATFPQRRFALVGDSGERDPEIYGALAREYPDQIVYIAIRDVTDEDAKHPRYAEAFAGVKAKWEVFESPESLQGP